MSQLKIILACIILIFTFALCIGSVILILSPMLTWFRKAPYVPSFNSHLKLIKDHLTLTSWAKLLDLGCGDGKAMRFFYKEFGLLCEGYDLNPFVILYGKLINRRKGIRNIKFVVSNFKKAQLHKYDYLYMYLFPNQMAAIEDWVFSNIKDDAIIIANSFKFLKHKPFDTIRNKKGQEIIRLYKK